jgi:NAD(P)-dependent dehydrogenase (short-subunit alcohol dehydrogenase family)
MSLTGRDALVVGGAGLLGGEISHALAELGARVIVTSRDVEKCRSFVSNLSRRGPAAHEALAVDITDPVSIRKLLEDTGRITAGGLDVLVNSGWSGRKNTFE